MREINDSQKKLYEEYDLKGSQKIFERYRKCLEKFVDRKCVRVLDVGGGSGYFSLRVKAFFEEQGVPAAVYVLDSAEYDTGRSEELASALNFVCDSAENMGKLFSAKSFDIIFMNRVFHHMVENSWRKTLDGVETFLYAAMKNLKDDGILCIMEHFYDGRMIDAATSFMIYSLTSIKNERVARAIKHFGGMSAGVGVCFQSEKMWTKRLKETGFSIAEKEEGVRDELGGIKKAVLMCKNSSRDNIIYAIKSMGD